MELGAIALAFARSGADLVICARSQEQLDEVGLEVEALGQKCATSAIDMGDVHAVENFYARSNGRVVPSISWSTMQAFTPSGVSSKIAIRMSGGIR